SSTPYRFSRLFPKRRVMNARAAFAEGRRVVNQNKALWLLFLVCNWAFASLLILPVFGLFSDTLGHSLYGERLFKELDPQWIAELSYNYRGIPTLITPLLIAAAVLYLLLNTFLAGGVLNVFNASDQRFSLPRFFGGGGKYFPR